MGAQSTKIEKRSEPVGDRLLENPLHVRFHSLWQGKGLHYFQETLRSYLKWKDLCVKASAPDRDLLHNVSNETLKWFWVNAAAPRLVLGFVFKSYYLGNRKAKGHKETSNNT